MKLQSRESVSGDDHLFLRPDGLFSIYPKFLTTVCCITQDRQKNTLDQYRGARKLWIISKKSHIHLAHSHPHSKSCHRYPNEICHTLPPSIDSLPGFKHNGCIVEDFEKQTKQPKYRVNRLHHSGQWS